MSTQQDFRSQLIPAFTPAQADAIVALITQARGILDAKADYHERKPDVAQFKADVDRLRPPQGGGFQCR